MGRADAGFGRADRAGEMVAENLMGGPQQSW